MWIEAVRDREVALGIHVLALSVEHNCQVMVRLGQLGVCAENGA